MMRHAPTLVPADPRVRGIAFVVLLVLLTVASYALTLPGSGTTEALPPTPPSPSSTPIGSTRPSPSAAPQTSAANHRRPARATPCGTARAAVFGGDTPTRICVPSIGVDASVLTLGLNPDHTVQVPQLSQVREAGWYKYSAAPGASGPTVILGHVDSAVYGDGVFFRLGTLVAGDRVQLTRADGVVATYRISRVDQVSKSRFPTRSVYGRTTRPTLRLVTCGGPFDSSTGNYLDNIIAYGRLVSLGGRRA